jgi:L-cystine transport system substrate-binding protein
MYMKKLSIAVSLVLAAAMSLAVAGCKKQAAGAAVVNVGTMGTYEPFSYVEADGRVTGYDIEVLRLIETVDPSLRFEFHAGPWDSLFPGLDSDRYQLLANQIVSTQERVKKYYMTKNTYPNSVSQLIVKKGRTDITSLESLVGKKIGTTVGDNYTRDLEVWNESHGNILTIVYYEEDITTVLQDIANGRIDATLNDPVMAQAKAAAQGLDVEPAGSFINPQPIILIMKQDAAGEALRDKLDAALAVLKADGRLGKLSVEYFGTDYTR